MTEETYTLRDQLGELVFHGTVEQMAQCGLERLARPIRIRQRLLQKAKVSMIAKEEGICNARIYQIAWESGIDIKTRTQELMGHA